MSKLALPLQREHMQLEQHPKDIKRSRQESPIPPLQISDRAGCRAQICGGSKISDGRRALVRFMLGSTVESGRLAIARGREQMTERADQERKRGEDGKGRRRRG
ncbi:hypothetical protein MRB53_019228 [Persea americana]|uniref:Uncharacterized protein n=1 Tax=Persea americana TaxID=3435 RepID=A0ACC2KXL9_PERAE|nr:hypothetical protein MRB53_019228 [Persea americana]